MGRTASALKCGGLLATVTVSSLSCARFIGAQPIGASTSLTTVHEIRVGDGRRSFILHRSPHLASPAPLFIVLHGTSASAGVVERESGMDPVADSLGALVVYPNGTGGIPHVRLFWNVEGCCGKGDARDESAMVRAIVDTLATHFAIDRSRIGLVGFSDSGTLAYLLACADADILTTIGVVAGELPKRKCSPSPPVSTVVFHGTADANIRYAPTPGYVAEWAQRQGCSAAREDSTANIVRQWYGRCADDVEIVLYSIVGGRHAWPGGRGSWAFAPRPSRAIDASRVFADFVLKHPRLTPR